MRTDEIIYGVTGQVVELPYPPEWSEGIPSAASASVFVGTDSNDETAEFTPAVSVDNTNGAIATASGFGEDNPRALNDVTLSAGSLVIGRHYRIVNTTNQTELIQIRKGGTDAPETLHPMAYAYAANDEFSGVRMSFTVNPTWVADETRILAPSDTPYRVVWAYTINSIARRHYTYLRLVRQPFKCLITIYDLAAYVPDIALSAPESQMGSQARDTIAKAVDRVRIDLLTQSVQPDSIRDTEVLKELQLRAALYIASFWHTPTGLEKADFVQRTLDDYKDLLARVTAGTLKMDVDTGREGSVTTRKFESMWLSR